MSKPAGTRGPVRSPRAHISTKFGGIKIPSGADPDEWIDLMKGAFSHTARAGFTYDQIHLMSDMALESIGKLIRDDGAFELVHVSER